MLKLVSSYRFADSAFKCNVDPTLGHPQTQMGGRCPFMGLTLLPFQNWPQTYGREPVLRGFAGLYKIRYLKGGCIENCPSLTCHAVLPGRASVCRDSQTATTAKKQQ